MRSRPDATFRITVCPVQTLTPCAAYLDQESRGLFGFHNWESCPDCKKESRGFEHWGENGHKQCSSSNVEAMRYYVGLKARTRWIASRDPYPGAVWGYRFRKGSTITYRR